MKPLLKLLLLALTGFATVASGDRVPLRPEPLPDLPAPMSNNAVALLQTGDGVSLFSFFGLESGKTWRDLSARAWVLQPESEAWSALPDLPGVTGRLAGTAVTVGGAIWLFGGYTVAEDGSEVSTPEVYRVGRGPGRAEHVTNMPVPVDDMVAFAYRERFVYLVSGWHDLGNVNLVQVLDTHTMDWAQATPYPGAPVFGHAGGMSGNRMLVCDGVRIEYPADGSARGFLPAGECWAGTVDGGDHRRIAWRPVPPHPGPPRYRMAAGADAAGRVVFVGGSANPYNYDGIGYDTRPSEPEPGVLVFDLESLEWKAGREWPGAGMDHRNLPYFDGWFYLVGGMVKGQALTRRVLRFRLDAPD